MNPTKYDRLVRVIAQTGSVRYPNGTRKLFYIPGTKEEQIEGTTRKGDANVFMTSEAKKVPVLPFLLGAQKLSHSRDGFKRRGSEQRSPSRMPFEEMPENQSFEPKKVGLGQVKELD